MNKKELQLEVDRLKFKNECLEAKIKILKDENDNLLNELTTIKNLELEYLSKKYNLVVLTDNITTRIAEDGKEIKKCKYFNIEQQVGELPIITTERNIYNEKI